MIACVEREIGWRERVYPRLVFSRKMTQAKADREIEVMRAVLAKLREASQIAEARAGSLR